ncbi:hypothetical protein [Luteococcus sanguinis]|uniref:Ricin B lectin domain-containing protein n=1 Tax=Luteococcus sanguinis TaxID=174038 RepID=A0ABW1X522_9ACTN
MSTDFEHDLKQHLAESARTHEVNLDLDELIARGRQGVRERNQRRAAWAGALCGVGLLTATMVTQQGTRTSLDSANSPSSLVEVRLDGNELANGELLDQPTFVARCGAAPAVTDCADGVQIEVRSSTGAQLVTPLDIRSGSGKLTEVASIMTAGGGDLQRWRVVTVPGNPTWVARVGRPGDDTPSEVVTTKPVPLGSSGVSVLLMRYDHPVGSGEKADIFFRDTAGVYREGTGRALPAATTQLLGGDVSVIVSEAHDMFELIAEGSGATSPLSTSSVTKSFTSQQLTGQGRAWAAGVLPQGARLVSVVWADNPESVETKEVLAGTYSCWVSAAEKRNTDFTRPTVIWRDSAGTTHTDRG